MTSFSILKIKIVKYAEMKFEFRIVYNHYGKWGMCSWGVHAPYSQLFSIVTFLRCVKFRQIQVKIVVYSLLPWLFLVCFACEALYYVRSHSQSPPLTHRYDIVSYLISTLANTKPSLEFTSFYSNNCVTCQCKLMMLHILGIWS